MDKLKIAILFGGSSTEYNISLQSAYSVITHLNISKYELILIGITKDGVWKHYCGTPEHIADDTWDTDADCTPAILSPSTNHQGILELRNGTFKLLPADLLFPVLHGRYGEDGTLQGLFEISRIPFVGCDTVSSAVCMDKDYAHKLVSLTGIEVPASCVLYSLPSKTALNELIDTLTFPLFVKPAKSGSSFGITKVTRAAELEPALQLAFKHDKKVVLERSIDGFEVGCAVLGNKELLLGAVDEIELSDGFFDFTEKYTLKTSNIHMPARISEKTAKAIKNTAKEIYRLLGCQGFARVDMFLTPDGKIVFNEVNTIPGFTSHSRYPNMLKGIGMEFSEILDTLIHLSFRKEIREIHGKDCSCPFFQPILLWAVSQASL